MNNIIFTNTIASDEYTEAVSKFYDLAKSDTITVKIPNNISLPDTWNIGVIFGSSGSGKSTLLKTLGNIKSHSWTQNSMISNFAPLSPAEAFKALNAVGFNTVPSWLKPYHVLSNGEQFRANLARSISSDDPLILIDEFTSVVDRNVAKSASNAISKYIKKSNKKIVLASCHADILEWLQPDWIYNTDECVTQYPRGSLHRPKTISKYSVVNMKRGNYSNHITI